MAGNRKNFIRNDMNKTEMFVFLEAKAVVSQILVPYITRKGSIVPFFISQLYAVEFNPCFIEPY